MRRQICNWIAHFDEMEMMQWAIIVATVEDVTMDNHQP